MNYWENRHRNKKDAHCLIICLIKTYYDNKCQKKEGVVVHISILGVWKIHHT